MAQPVSRDPLIFALSESRELALAACRRAGLPLSELEEHVYEGGEFKLRPLQSVRDRSVFVIQSLAQTDTAPITERLVRLLFLMHGLKDAGAARLVAVIPYLAYARKDRRTRSRDPVYTRYLAQQLECAGADRVVALDVHSAPAFDNAFRIPVDHLTALPMMATQLMQELPNADLAVASPDIGGIKRAQLLRELLERRTGKQCGLIFLEKRRDGGTLSGGAIVGDARSRAVVLIDDLCATGSTMTRAAAVLREAGARSVHVAITHAPLAPGVATLLAANEIDQVIITDSVGFVPQGVVPPGRRPATILPAGELIGCAIARMAGGQSLAPLWEQWPVPAQ